MAMAVGTAKHTLLILVAGADRGTSAEMARRARLGPTPACATFPGEDRAQFSRSLDRCAGRVLAEFGGGQWTVRTEELSDRGAPGNDGDGYVIL